MLSVVIKTLGCKLNQAESAMIARDFVNRGYCVVDSGERADVSVINTCTVTLRSDAKCRQEIRKSMKANPDTTVIVTGCYPQVSVHDIADIPGVDYVLGVQEKLDIFKYFSKPGKLKTPLIAVASVRHTRHVIDHSIGYYGNQTRAALKIQSGCDNRCTYCIVPAARGPGRSVPMDTVLTHARQLVRQGYREIVITGVHIGEYGKTLPGHPDLPGLLRKMTDVEELSRIRLSSLEPQHVSDNLLNVMSDHNKICRHFHLSIQSGSPEILKAMGRKSSRTDIEQAIQKILDAFPEAGMGTDIIVGFPGETDRHFQETRDFIGQFPFSYFHIFPFSPRPGTPAAVLLNQIAVRERAERVKQLRALGRQKSILYRERWTGRVVDVLFEGKNRHGGMTGWTSQYVRAEVKFDPALVNRLVPVRLGTLTEQGIRGKVIALES